LCGEGRERWRDEREIKRRERGNEPPSREIDGMTE
jgi:hypothetical protein